MKRVLLAWLAHERRIQLLAIAGGLPAVLTCSYLLLNANPTPARWLYVLLMTACWIGFAAAVREKTAAPLRTLANLLEALREGDYSIRVRGDLGQDSMAKVVQQVNAMAATLRAQRLDAVEATTLLRKVMEEIDVGVFAFDAAGKLKLVNRAGERLLSLPFDNLINRRAEELGLAELLTGDPARIVQRSFASGSGRWGMSRSHFREGGLPHDLLVISDLTRALREEELQAWQRLVRVLGHELNNSLTPIKSIAGSLETMLQRKPLAEDWEEDMRRGLGIIGARSESLSRFLGAYARLAKLPRPRLQDMDVQDWVRRVVALETRLPVAVYPGPPARLQGDPDQLEQLLINVVHNAVEASLETGGHVQLQWLRTGGQIEIAVRDEGPGLLNTANLFVPFFTTKPGGSGIGLVLSRQIAEAHGGSLVLENRPDRRGCQARLLLPA